MSVEVATVIGVWGCAIATWVAPSVRGWIAISMTAIATITSATLM